MSKDRLALEVVRLILGDDRKAMLHVGMQLIELGTGKKKRISSKRKTT